MKESSFAFILPFVRSLRCAIQYNESKIPLPAAIQGHEVVLASNKPDKTIQDSISLILRGAWFTTREEAEREAQFYLDVLSRSFVRVRMGVSLGERATGLTLISHNLEKPVMSDFNKPIIIEKPGITVFPSIQARGYRGIPLDDFKSAYKAALEAAIKKNRKISDQERMAILMFNGSFFQESPYIRFILLMIGMEALIEQQPLPDNIQAIIERFMKEIDNETGLKDDERESLRSRIGALKKESIRQAGLRMIREKLNQKEYGGMSPDDFFNYCYQLRNKIVHAKELPERGVVGSAASTLEIMLSDLLSIDLLDIGYV